MDGATGEPVAGVLVEASYRWSTPGLFHGYGGDSPQGWTYTDPDGRFVIPGRWKLGIAGSWSPAPTLSMFHPDYGWDSDDRADALFRRWHGFTIGLRPPAEYEPLDDERSSPASACHASPALCREFCLVAFPGVQSCGVN